MADEVSNVGTEHRLRDRGHPRGRPGEDSTVLVTRCDLFGFHVGEGHAGSGCDDDVRLARRNPGVAPLPEGARRRQGERSIPQRRQQPPWQVVQASDRAEHDGSRRELERSDDRRVDLGGRQQHGLGVLGDAATDRVEVHRQGGAQQPCLSLRGDTRTERDDVRHAVDHAQCGQLTVDLDERDPRRDVRGQQIGVGGSSWWWRPLAGDVTASAPHSLLQLRGLEQQRSIVDTVARLGVELGEHGAQPVEVDGELVIIWRPDRRCGERRRALALGPLERGRPVTGADDEAETEVDELGHVQRDVRPQLGSAQCRCQRAELVDGPPALGERLAGSIRRGEQADTDQAAPAPRGEAEIAPGRGPRGVAATTVQSRRSAASSAATTRASALAAPSPEPAAAEITSSIRRTS